MKYSVPGPKSPPFRPSGSLFRRLSLALAPTALAAFMPMNAAPAHAEALTTRYAVNLSGMYLGDAIVRTQVDARGYKVAVAADIGALVFNIAVRGEATGVRTGTTLTPERFRLVVSGMEESAVDIRFSGALAASTKITPPLPPHVLKDRVPITAKHRTGVVDPLSALLITSLKPATAAADPCDAVIPIYAGYVRFNVSLKRKPGPRLDQEGSTVTCQAQPIAIAGHPRRKTAELGLQNMKVDIAFKRLAKPKVWLLQHLSIPTPAGTVIVERAQTVVSSLAVPASGQD